MSYLDDLVGPLKRAAIDAYMRDQNYSLSGDKYRIANRGDDITVTRPGEDGEGGGNWDGGMIANIFMDKTEEFQAAFDSVRSTIDDYLEPWHELPEAGDVQPFVESMRQACRTLSADSSTAFGGTSGAGEIAGSLSALEQTVNGLEGQTIAAFKSRYLLRLSSTISSLRALGVVLGSNLTGEQEIWEGIRDEIVKVVTDATEGLAAHGAGGGGSWETSVEIAGMAARGFGAFATGGPAGFVQGVTLAVDLATGDLLSDITGSGGSAQELLDAFGQSLTDISDRIAEQEQLLADNLTTNKSNAEADRGSYDLTVPGEVSEADEASDLAPVIINRASVEEIAGTYLPDIATSLTTAAEQVDAAYDASMVSRTYGVGMTSIGPMNSYYPLSTLLSSLLRDLAWEVQMGGETLRLVLADMEGVDTGVAQQLEDHAKEFGAGSGEDPWDENQPPPRVPGQATPY